MTEKLKQENDADSIQASDQNVDQTVDVGAYLVLEDAVILKGKKVSVYTCCTRIPTRDKRFTSIRTAYLSQIAPFFPSSTTTFTSPMVNSVTDSGVTLDTIFTSSVYCRDATNAATIYGPPFVLQTVQNSLYLTVRDRTLCSELTAITRRGFSAL